MKRRTKNGKWKLILIAFVGLQLALFAVLARNHIRTRLSLDGAYEGIEKLMDPENPVRLVLFHTEDGFISGTWKSNGGIRRGVVSGELGVCSHDINLTVTEGDCRGKFSGRLKVADGKVFGSLSNNPLCPGYQLQFDLVKM